MSTFSRSLKTPERSVVHGLAEALTRVIEGEVRFDDGSRALYSTDGSNYRQIPIGVVVPRSIEDVVQMVDVCRRFDVPIVARGGGTSLTGNACNVAVVIDFSKYLRNIIEIDPQKKWAWVQPGVVCDTLRNTAEEFGLTFGPDPSTHNHCVLGGMIGNNSCGNHAQMSGRVADNIHELEFLTYDGTRMIVGETSPEALEQIISEGGRRGEIYSRLKRLSNQYAPLIREKFPPIPRRISGYGLDELLPENGFQVARALVGTEGTCGLVLAAKTRLIYSPRNRSLLVVGFDEIAQAGDWVPEVILSGPIALEGLDDKLVALIREKGKEKDVLDLLPDGRSFLMAEYGGETKEEADGKARLMMEYFRRRGVPLGRMKLADDPAREKQLWKVRESGLGMTAFAKGKPDTHEGWEDAAVPPARLGEYLRSFRELLDRFEYDTSLYGHFGQGCVHCRIDFDLKTKEGIEKYRKFIDCAADLVISCGGSLSGEHGDGQSRGELLGKMYGPQLMDAFREFKAIWDPTNRMNPGKKINAYAPTDNLRLGTDYDPRSGKTFFQFPDDNGSFSHATERCVGVGECRRKEKGTMCPSYRVTNEEMHSTRGRAHMLFETMRGGLKKGWRDEHTKEALDLCLSCKGCKGDCPVEVDVATLKSEFLAHYYSGRLRPRVAYSIGGIYWWARMGSLLPGLANAVLQSKVLGGLAKRIGGLAPERPVPQFAKRTFKSRWKSRRASNPDRPEVMLWVDTFNNHFSPEVAEAAVDVLEEAGYRVSIPSASLCCGRPLYDYGFLNAAKSLLIRILHELKEPIEQGIPLVALEPSCLAVFRDELTNLMPDNEQAKRLRSQSFLLSEFLIQKADYHPPEIKIKLLVQAHCHQKALVGTNDLKELLSRMKAEFEIMDNGCCGLAGSFGFEANHYEISNRIGEYEVAGRIRKALEKDPDLNLLADGFSCHHQIENLTGIRSIHLAQVIQKAICEKRQKREAADHVQSAA